MDISAIDKKMHGSKPVRYVAIGGIILAILTFFILLFLFFRLLFGLGYQAVASAYLGMHSNATSTSRGNFFGLPVTQEATSTDANTQQGGALNAVPVYAEPAQNGGSGATPVYANPVQNGGAGAQPVYAHPSP